MKLSDIEKRIPLWYKSGLCVYLRGRIGRGKSTVIEAAANRLSKMLEGNYGIVIINGPLLNPPDAVGYLMPEKRGEYLMSLFTQPFWFITTEGKHINEYDGGIVLVDEADKMDTDVKKVIGEAALSGRLGPHVLPGFANGSSAKGWRLWMAGNRLEDRSGSTKEYDHLINRRMEINVDDDLQSTEDWMLSNGVLPAIVTFAVQNPQIVLAEELPTKQGPFCTPRSLVRFSAYLKGMAGEGEDVPTDAITREEAAGMIGEGAAAQLFATLELSKQMPKYDAIVADPKKAKAPTAPDAQMLVCYELAARVDAKTLGPIITYVERFPPEFTVMFGRAAVRRDPSLVTTKEFHDWTKRNASLMMAIVSIS